MTQIFWKLYPKIIRQLKQESCSLPKQIKQLCWIFSPSEGALMFDLQPLDFLFTMCALVRLIDISPPWWLRAICTIESLKYYIWYKYCGDIQHSIVCGEVTSQRVHTEKKLLTILLETSIYWVLRKLSMSVPAGQLCHVCLTSCRKVTRSILFSEDLCNMKQSIHL